MIPLPPPVFNRVAQPGVIVSNAWPQSRITTGATLDVVRHCEASLRSVWATAMATTRTIQL